MQILIILLMGVCLSTLCGTVVAFLMYSSVVYLEDQQEYEGQVDVTVPDGSECHLTNTETTAAIQPQTSWVNQFRPYPTDIRVCIGTTTSAGLTPCYDQDAVDYGCEMRGQALLPVYICGGLSLLSLLGLCFIVYRKGGIKSTGKFLLNEVVVIDPLKGKGRNWESMDADD
ncbi:hypothetical protein KIPB_004807 [Kipferlia bialata]|uniref:Uncharacterized protein n=1 Tax=Kipferlia bialata TaxID=797122 RepID=A0A9K3CV23_9EUKA|nr:hypothetical protein KIPB_004807 [Kipferlia bialata]|eukprot:g4807.t1